MRNTWTTREGTVIKVKSMKTETLREIIRLMEEKLAPVRFELAKREANAPALPADEEALG